MTLRYLLDTDIVSYYVRRSAPTLEDRVNDALKHHTTPSLSLRSPAPNCALTKRACRRMINGAALLTTF